MSQDLPDDWYEEHDGQRLVLRADKVAAEIDRLRAANEHNEKAVHSCNQKISELELWNREYREQIAFWRAKAKKPDDPGQPTRETP